MDSNNYTVVDLFCGAGGLTHGFVKQKFNIAAGIDSDSSCEYAFTTNNKAKFICKEIQSISAEEIKQLYPKGSIKILIGCAPCQPFSRYTKGMYNTKKKGEKWNLLSYFAKLIEEVQPDIISMENVPQLAKYDKQGVYGKFIKTLKNNGYHISDTKRIVFCPEYGVPQNRRRLVLLASKFGDIELMPPIYSKENLPTVRQFIGDLPKIEDGEICATDSLHRSRKLSDLNKKRIEHTKLGGGWKDWDNELQLDCHKKETGKTFGSVYGRMKWDEPSPTMTTQCIGLGNGRFGHPDQHRAISLREAAMLQSFPKTYKFINPKSDKIVIKDLQRHIGNAVPVKLGEAIAKSIKLHLKEYSNG
ncbi:MAG: (cytosine-5-)-methyltransferase [Chitinophagaceae bacterium]|nr:(cytosine-5-)-methyltransferase [Chitinophagaceae bacterium]